MKVALRSALKRSLQGVVLVFFLLLAIALALVFFQVTLDLAFLRGTIERTAGSALGREVAIDGSLIVKCSTWPVIEVDKVEISNAPEGTLPYFLSVGHARLQIGLLPLVTGNIQLGDVIAENVSLNLENNEQGHSNWIFDNRDVPAGADEKPKEASQKASSGTAAVMRHFGVRNLSLENINILYRDALLDRTISLQVEELDGEAIPGEPTALALKGELQGRKYDLRFDGGAVDEMFSKDAVWQFSLRGEVSGEEIVSQGYLTGTGGEPEAHLEFSLKDLDIGAILAELGIVEDFMASAGSAGFEVTLTGKSFRDLFERSSIALYIDDGMFRIQGPASAASFYVTNLEGRIFARQGMPVTMKLQGTVDNMPVSMVIAGAPLIDYVTAPQSIPLVVDASVAKTEMRLAGEFALPISSKDLSMSLELNTPNLDNLNDMFDLNLPSIGPIAFASRFQLQGKKYDIREVGLQVGESRLEGNMSLDMAPERPELNVELLSQQIRLDDFNTLFRKMAAAQQSEEKEEKKKEKNGDMDRREILSPEVLGSLNGDLLVEAQRVTSGPDTLGSGSLKVSLRDGRLVVAPLRIEIPGGGVQVDVDYLPADDGVTFGVKAAIERFDLGLLMRQVKPESDMGGILTLDTDLYSQAPHAKSIMKNATGHFDFLLVPQNFSAGILDLWVVNLLSAIMTEVAEEEKSEINCLVVRCAVEDGLMEEEAIYMDTSKMRLSGRADIDFIAENIDIMLVPKAKKPEFFSLAVPVRVKGSFDDFGLKIGAFRIAKSLLSFITSPVHVPIRRIFADEIPEDGQEACRQAWLTTGDKK